MDEDKFDGLLSTVLAYSLILCVSIVDVNSERFDKKVLKTAVIMGFHVLCLIVSGKVVPYVHRAFWMLLVKYSAMLNALRTEEEWPVCSVK